MKALLLPFLAALTTLALLSSCANIVPPTGGEKDVAPPKLLSISPADSQLNLRPRKLVLAFDEYVNVADAAKQVQISPLLSIPLTVAASGKRVTVSIPDTLLQGETTYRISFGNAIRDIHEANIYQSSGFIFSTGSHFDSLSLAGAVYDASTGLRDSSAVVLLYDARDGDSAVVRKKPLYAVHVGAFGDFLFEGLPQRAFRIYALRDGNGNLMFDGGTEWIGFLDSLVTPARPQPKDIVLRSFQEKNSDTSAASEQAKRSDRMFAQAGRQPSEPRGAYSLNVDTTDLKRRTQDLNEPVTIRLAQRPEQGLREDKLFLVYDSAGATVEAPFTVSKDSTGLSYELHTSWLENTVYTLRLQKGFAQDSSGKDLMPGRFSFRTKRDEDYGKLRVHLPGKFYKPKHVLQVVNEHDTVYQQPVLDTIVSLLRLPPGIYTLRVIGDENENGRWDAGDLFLRRQPELVTPYRQPINLKAGWEQQVDFEEKERRKGGF
jgi:hypothetical protein